MKLTIELENVSIESIKKNIDAQNEAINKSSGLEFVNLIDTLSILKGIERELKIWL